MCVEHILEHLETYPQTTGDATLVPDNERQPPCILDPRTCSNEARKALSKQTCHRRSNVENRITHITTIRHYVRFNTTIAMRQLPCGHSPRGKRCNLVLVVNASYSNDIILIGWIVESSIQRTIITDRGNHDYPIRCNFPNLFHKRDIQVIWPTDTEINNVHFRCNRIIESVEKP